MGGGFSHDPAVFDDVVHFPRLPADASNLRLDVPYVTLERHTGDPVVIEGPWIVPLANCPDVVHCTLIAHLRNVGGSGTGEVRLSATGEQRSGVFPRTTIEVVSLSCLASGMRL